MHKSIFLWSRCRKTVLFKGMAVITDEIFENHAKRFSLALDSGSKLGCDVPSAYPPIHLWLEVRMWERVGAREGENR